MVLLSVNLAMNQHIDQGILILVLAPIDSLRTGAVALCAHLDFVQELISEGFTVSAAFKETPIA